MPLVLVASFVTGGTTGILDVLAADANSRPDAGVETTELPIGGTDDSAGVEGGLLADPAMRIAFGLSVDGLGMGLAGEALGAAMEEARTAANVGAAGRAAVTGEGALGALCFAQGTKVLMGDGSTKAIQEIHEGEMVLADDPDDAGEASPRKVTLVHRTATHRLFHVEIVDGGEVVATGGHPFWTQRGWVPAEALSRYDVLVDDRGRGVAIRALAVESRDAPTFNLSVEGAHTFFVVAGRTPVLVHNVDPWDVLFTQPTYGATFTDGPLAGRSVAEVAAEARALGRLPDGLTLNAIRMGDGRWATLNNRTLAVARMANLPDVSPVDSGAKGMNTYRRLLRDGGLSGPIENATMRCR